VVLFGSSDAAAVTDTFELIFQSLYFTITVYSVFIASRDQKLHNLRTLGERNGLLCIQQLGTLVVEAADLDNHTKQADGRCLSSVFLVLCFVVGHVRYCLLFCEVYFL
jgi:hypothetical protein